MRAKICLSLLLLLIVPQLNADESKHSSYLEQGTFLVVEVTVDEAIQRVEAGIDDILAFCKEHDLGIEEEIDDAALGQIRGMLKIAQGFGIQTATVYLSIEDIKINYGPLVVLSVKEGTSAKATQLMLQALMMNDSSIPIKAEVGADGTSVLLGMPSAISQYQEIEPTDRTDLMNALESTEGLVRFAFSPGEDARRVIRELWPSLPRPFETLSGELLADRMQHLTGDFSWEKTPRLSIRLAMTDDRSAELMNELVQIGISQGVVMLLREEPSATELVNLLQEFPSIKRDGERIEMRLDLDEDRQTDFNKKMIAALSAPIKAARESAQRNVQMNKMRQLVLAMLNFYEIIDQFPAPAAICDAEGKPLLSWRVAILPFLEQNELYNRFHLDEPWDSSHNLQLVKEMPAMFASDQLPKLNLEGKTVLLRPIFDGHDQRRESKRDEVRNPIQKEKEGKAYFYTPWLEYRDYVDGTSNTALIVEVNAKNAVPWTKPADWEVDMENPKKGLFVESSKNEKPTLALVGFTDGSARFMHESIAAEMLRRIINHHDGEPVAYDRVNE